MNFPYCHQLEMFISKSVLLHIFDTKLIYLYCFAFELASTPIMEQSPKNVTVLDGKDATIVCRAVGAPQPNVTWTYNGELIQLSVQPFENY